MDFALSEEQKLIVDTVRDFAENEIYPHEEEVERDCFVRPEVGDEIKEKCKKIGFYALILPTSVGGGGLAIWILRFWSVNWGVLPWL